MAVVFAEPMSSPATMRSTFIEALRQPDRDNGGPTLLPARCGGRGRIQRERYPGSVAGPPPMMHAREAPKSA